MSKIFLVRGYKGSGKDTLGDYLVKERGFEKLSFASPLKDETCRQYDFPRSFGDDQSMKEKPLVEYPVKCLDEFSSHINSFIFREFRTEDGRVPFGVIIDKGFMYGTDENLNNIGKLFHCPRSLFILEGSVKRSVYPDYWVENVINKVDSGKNYIITDWRYRSEVSGIKRAVQNSSRNLGVYTIEVQRFDAREISSTDPSERDLDGYTFDFTINNRKKENVTLSQLFSQAEQIVDSVTGGS